MGKSKNGSSSKRTSVRALNSVQRAGTLRLLTADHLRQVLTPRVCLDALRAAYAALPGDPRGTAQTLGFKGINGGFHVKAGLLPKSHAFFAAKVNANFPHNPRLHGLPTIQGLVILMSGDDGRPLAVLDSGELTARRTAAATALAASYGAGSGSKRLGVVGCGRQALYQVEAILGILRIGKITAYDIDARQAQSFVRSASQTLGVPVSALPSAREVVQASDICVTCTTATAPVVTADMVSPGCFIAAVGADNPEKQELDPCLFSAARIIVDDFDQCAAYGDLAHALRSDTVTRADVVATLAELVAGSKPARVSPADIVIFDSTGVGVQDVATAAAAFEVAKAKGIGDLVTLTD